VDVLDAARTLFHITQGARIPWVNGLLSDDACLDTIRRDVELVFSGLSAH
jgi:hypothetical protein